MALVLREEVNKGLGSLGEHGNDDDGHVVEVERSHKQGQNHKEGNHVTDGTVWPWEKYQVLGHFFFAHKTTKKFFTLDGCTSWLKCLRQSMWTSFWRTSSPFLYEWDFPSERIWWSAQQRWNEGFKPRSRHKWEQQCAASLPPSPSPALRTNLPHSSRRSHSFRPDPLTQETVQAFLAPWRRRGQRRNQKQRWGRQPRNCRSIQTWIPLGQVWSLKLNAYCLKRGPLT